jgi:hypothetical protein
MSSTQSFVNREDVKKAIREKLEITIEGMSDSHPVPEGGEEVITFSRADIIDMDITASNHLEEDFESETVEFDIDISAQATVNGQYMVGGEGTEIEPEISLDNIHAYGRIVIPVNKEPFNSKSQFDPSKNIGKVVIDPKDVDFKFDLCDMEEEERREADRLLESMSGEPPSSRI